MGVVSEFLVSTFLPLGPDGFGRVGGERSSNLNIWSPQAHSPSKSGRHHPLMSNVVDCEDAQQEKTDNVSFCVAAVNGTR